MTNEKIKRMFDAFYQAKRGAPPSEELTRCFAELLEGGEE